MTNLSAMPRVMQGGAEADRRAPVGLGAQADIGRCTLIDWSSPTATHTANIDEPP